MLLYEDIIIYTLRGLLQHAIENLSEKDELILFHYVKNFAFKSAHLLYKNKKIKYSYTEKMIICKNITEHLFVLCYLAIDYKISLCYYGSLLNELTNNIIKVAEQNFKFDIINKNDFYYYTKYCVIFLLFKYKNKSNNKYLFLIQKNFLFFFFSIKLFLSQINSKAQNDNADLSNQYDILLQVGKSILKTNTFLENTIFESKINSIKNNCLYKYGYYISHIYIKCNLSIRKNSYKIYIKNKRVRKGFFDYKDSNSLDAILDTLEKVLIEQVHKVFTEKTTKAYLDYVKRTYSKKVVKDLLKHLDVYSIKTIFCNLIQQEISIANICYVVKKLAEFSRTDNDIDSLTEKMKNVLV